MDPAKTVLQIQLRDWPLGPFVHHYVALREIAWDGATPPRDASLAEIHGLATLAGRPDTTAINPLELGGGSNLYAYRFCREFLPGALNRVIASTEPCAAGAPTREALIAAFDAAFRQADAQLNALDLRYRVASQNSNTVARWIADRLLTLLDLPGPLRPGWRRLRPGWRNLLHDPVLERDRPRTRPWPRRATAARS